MDEFRAGVLARVWEKVQRTARAGAVYPYVKDESLEHTLSTGVDCAAREYLRKALDITADRVPFGALGDMYIMSQKNDEHRPTLFYRMVQTIVTEQKETDLMLLQKVNNSQLQMRASTPAGGFACMLWEVCVMMEKKGGLSLHLELWEHLLEEIGDMINRWFDPDYDTRRRSWEWLLLHSEAEHSDDELEVGDGYESVWQGLCDPACIVRQSLQETHL